MDRRQEDTIVEILNGHRLMAVGTIRSDGWPQVTTVSYVNHGLTPYFFVARFGQKLSNILRDARVSAAISSDFSNPMRIQGLSLAGRAVQVDDSEEFSAIADAFVERFPEYGEWPRPSSTFSPLLKIVPEVISIVDYSQGFGHTETVTLAHPKAIAAESTRSNWFSRLLS